MSVVRNTPRWFPVSMYGIGDPSLESESRFARRTIFDQTIGGGGGVRPCVGELTPALWHRHANEGSICAPGYLLRAKRRQRFEADPWTLHERRGWTTKAEVDAGLSGFVAIAAPREAAPLAWSCQHL